MTREEEELFKNERRELCRIHSKRLDALDDGIKRLDLALYGNGNPKKGILWIATTNKDTIDWVAKISVGIFTIVSANILIKVVPVLISALSRAMK